MGWMIYILIGIGIILLCYCIVRLTSKKKEGLSDYFNIGEYIDYLINDNSNTVGRYLHVMPRPLRDGAGNKYQDSSSQAIETNGMHISQIMVYDMDGRNIALNKQVTVVGQSNKTVNPSIIVDGTTEPRREAIETLTNTCNATDYREYTVDICSSYITIDLGATYQISSIGFVGKLTNDAQEAKILSDSTHMMVFQLLDKNYNQIWKDILPVGETIQTLECPNAFRQEASTSDPSITPSMPNLVSFDYGLEEVFLTNKTPGPRSNAELSCNILGARLARKGEVQNAFKNKAEWCEPGWVADDTQNAYYISQGEYCPDTAGVKSVNTGNSMKAGSICIGVKPILGSANSAGIEDFNMKMRYWSLYIGDRYFINKNRSIGYYFGESSILVPNAILLKEYVYNYFIPVSQLYTEWVVNAEAPLVSEELLKEYNLLGPVNPLDPKTNPFYEIYLRGSPINWLYDMKNTLTNAGTLFEQVQPDGSKVNLFPLDEPMYSQNPKQNFSVNVPIFGKVSAAALAELNSNLNLCSKLYLGSLNNIDKFVSIKFSDVATLYPVSNINSDNVLANITSKLANPPRFDSVAYIRNGIHPTFAKMGTRQKTNFCRPEVVQNFDTSVNIYKTSQANKDDMDWNEKYCSEKITTDMLGLLPDPTRQYLIDWIYNRTDRFLQQIYGVQYNSSNQPIDGYGNILTSEQAAAFNTKLKILQAGLKPMQPTVNSQTGGSSQQIPLDVTNKYTLDTIAQGFYEMMGGLYTMTLIYDVFTIGGTIFDIRFDITKHKDNSEAEKKIIDLTAKYIGLRAQNVSQDVLETAKSNYKAAVADIRASEVDNVYPPITGVVGRFFYTYNATEASVTITGITLDARAVTSFIPELNGGILVSTGTDAGTLNYPPNTVYTMNVPKPLDCSDIDTLKNIMDDYVDATNDKSETGLAATLLNASPSMDTSKGTVKIRSIIGSKQVSKTQCAITWTESLWNMDTNTSIVPEVKRNALFTYSASQIDWYSSDINFDATGFAYFRDANVPECKFDATSYKETISSVIDTNNMTETDIQTHFVKNTFNNGAGGYICPRVLPKYKFNIYDYLYGNPSQNIRYNPGGPTQIDINGAINHYTTSGIGTEPIRAREPIPPFDNPIIFPEPIPPTTDLDDAGGVCPATACDDLDVLYTIADSYNKDPTEPGTILRIKRVYTKSAYQCDIEADVNYDSTVKNSEDIAVQKGSFIYADDGKTQIPAKITIPTGIKTDTFGIDVYMDLQTCTIQYNGSNGMTSGKTIQNTTPKLYKPLEYATEYKARNLTSFNSIVNGITDAIQTAGSTSVSVLSSYRQNTATAVGAIATLGGCGSKCSDTANLNAMIAYYKANRDKPNTQINTIFYAGTPNETTCDITFQEDTLAQSGSSYTISASQTVGMRFTMASNSGSNGSNGSNGSSSSCTFTPTAMTRKLPSPFDLSSPAFTNNNEVYYVDGNMTRSNAERICKMFNAVVASKEQINQAMVAGADWCSTGWVVDVSGTSFAPVSKNTGFGCPSAIGLNSSKAVGAGFNCYGVKPPRTKNAAIKEFSKGVWNQTPFTPYVNPTKEAFQNYGAPIQVTESTFPLNTKSFGLDRARNGDSDLDTLYKEPLRQVAGPGPGQGPKYLNVDEPLEKAKSYRYIRFRPMLTRDPASESVSVGKFRFFLGKNEIDLTNAKVSNPMGTWIGDATDITGEGYKNGWTDLHKKSIIFAFPYPILMDGFTWITTNPDRGIGSDPVQWKLEGSQNGTFWTMLRDQSRNYPVPVNRFQELPIFKF